MQQPKTADSTNLLAASPLLATLDDATQWRCATAPVDYLDAVSAMESRVANMAQNTANGCVWLLEHPALYTAGTSAREADLLSNQLPVFQTGRGGQYTYHGPGQRVAYVMRDLAKHHKSDLRGYVCRLEDWLIAALQTLGVKGERRAGRVGIWVDMAPYGRPNTHMSGEAKIAALGVRVRKSIAYHGVSINLDPDLAAFGGIVPCGIHEHGVTSLHDLGIKIGMKELDAALLDAFKQVFVSGSPSAENCSRSAD